MGNGWNQLAWKRRFDAAPRYYRAPRAQFDRDDETFLRREEAVGDYRIVLLQTNKYRERTKLFRVETWSASQDVDAPVTYYEESTQTAAEIIFERIVSELTEIVTEGETCE
ncbi:hypothetical protein [Paenibacillus sp. PAMC21692]|uniref:hypothetical protein n=1 Tax=Paenibacillus sp. PAMC21692 TaxID=2762320 RepID=UPI00164D834D|nr:hypothetical protein [Paenibacillus sp. PAMC21692]QNK54551.1 hypothetical protein H7F31_17975 [Paenibacillus sp. PAMC21692]